MEKDRAPKETGKETQGKASDERRTREGLIRPGSCEPPRKRLMRPVPQRQRIQHVGRAGVARPDGIRHLWNLRYIKGPLLGGSAVLLPEVKQSRGATPCDGEARGGAEVKGENLLRCFVQVLLCGAGRGVNCFAGQVACWPRGTAPIVRENRQDEVQVDDGIRLLMRGGQPLARAASSSELILRTSTRLVTRVASTPLKPSRRRIGPGGRREAMLA